MAPNLAGKQILSLLSWMKKNYRNSNTNSGKAKVILSLSSETRQISSGNYAGQTFFKYLFCRYVIL